MKATCPAGRVPPGAPGFGLPRHDGLGTGGPGEDAMERHGVAVPRRNAAFWRQGMSWNAMEVGSEISLAIPSKLAMGYKRYKL